MSDQNNFIDNETTKSNKLKYNVILNSLYEILLVVAPLITAPYISRILCSDGVGINSYVNSLVTYFTMVAALGTVAYGGREIARKRTCREEYSKSFWEIELITVFTSLICLLLWLLLSYLYVEYSSFLLILSLNIIACIFNINWFYVGLEKFKYTVTINAIVKIISVVLIFVLVKEKSDLSLYILINSGAIFLGSFSMWFFLPKFIDRPKIEWKNVWKHLKGTLIYFIPTISASIYTMVDKSLIGIITKDNNENGFYEQATKIISIAKSIAIFGINGVMCSRANFLFAKDNKYEAHNLILTTFELTLFLSIGICFGIIGVSKEFVPIFFGNGYDPVVFLLIILSPILIPICISNTLYQVYYSPSGMIKKATTYMVIGTFINVILNIVFISLWKSVGAVISSLTAEVIICILFIFSASNFVSFSEIFNKIWKKFLSGIFMILFIYTFRYFFGGLMNNFLLLIFEILLGGISYLLALILLRDSSFKTMLKFMKARR